MKSKCSIEMDFSDAISQAQELEDLSKGLSRIASNSIPWALAVIANAWRGENSIDYIRKGENMSDTLMKLADEMYKVACDIRFTATAVYKAEIAALDYVNNLWY